MDDELRDHARQSWSFGLAAILLCVVAPCSTYMTLVLALPLGWFAYSRARGVLARGAAVDEASEVYARTGQVTGLVALAWSALILVLGIGLVLLYAGMFAAILAAEL